MKIRLKKLSKSTVSIVLTLVMLMSMAVVGMVNVNAWGINSGAKVYFLAPSGWSDVLMLYSWNDNTTESNTVNLTKVANSTNLYYVKFDSTINNSQRYAFADGKDWGSAKQSIGDRKGTNSSQIFNDGNYNDQLEDNYYCFTGTNGSFAKSSNSNKDTLMKINVTAEVYTDGANNNNGGEVNVAGYYFGDSDTSLLTTTAYGSTESTVYSGVKGAPFTLTAVSKTGFRFDGWYSSTSATTALSSDETYSVSPTTATTYYARFVTDEEFHDVTLSASEGGTITPSGTQSVGEKTKQLVTATAKSGYAFSSWTVGDGITLSDEAISGDNATANIVTKASGTYSLQANFAKKSYSITYPTDATGFTVDKSGQTETVEYQANGSEFTVTPADGYDVKVSYTVDGGASQALEGNNHTYQITSMPAGDVVISVTAKKIVTVHVDVDEHASVTVAGSTVAGQNQTFTADGSFTALAGDVISYSGAGNPSSDYTINALYHIENTGSEVTSPNSFTVADGSTYTIFATSKEKSGYYFYVSADAHTTVTVQLTDNTKNFSAPSVANSISVAAGTRQKFVVDDSDLSFTITATPASGYENATVLRVANASDEAATTVTDAQTEQLARGATYYATSSKTYGSTDSDYYLYYRTGASESAGTMSGPIRMKYVSGGAGKVWADVDLAAYDDVIVITKENSWKQDADHNTHISNIKSSDGSVDINASNARKTTGTNTYTYLKPNSAGTYRIVFDSSDNSTADITKASGSSTVITDFDTYYLGGRFRIKDSDTGEYVYTDAKEGSWASYSIRMPFTRQGDTTEYTLETNQTVAQLSALLNGKLPYFVVHDKKKLYGSSASGGLNFENNNEGNKLDLAEKSGLTYQEELLFSDADSSSDGMVTIHFDSNSDSKKIWYTVSNETKPVASSVALVAQNSEGTPIENIVAGSEVTLVATVTSPVVNAGELTYTFVNTTTNETIGTVKTTELTASVTVSESVVRTDTFKVTVSSQTVDPNTGKQVRDVYNKCDVRFTSPALYVTKTNLSGSTDKLCSDASWNPTPLTPDADNIIELDLSAKTTYEFAIASAIPTDNNDKTTLEGKCPEDFYLDETLTKYCDIEYFTLTVSYKNADKDDEQYVVRTYRVTPRTNSANPKIHINTNPVSKTAANGEVKYYPGTIYAVAAYTAGKSNTKELNPMETVTYYFAEAVGDEDMSVTNDGMAIAYWNNSLDNIREKQDGDNAAKANDQVAKIKKLTTYTAVATPVKMLNNQLSDDEDASNIIYVDMDKLYLSKAGNESGQSYKQFKVYSVELPVWATSFAFTETATAGTASTDGGEVIKTTSWNDGVEYGYTSLLLNPNRVYLLYSNQEDNNKYWYSKAVVLDKGLWNSSTKNDVGTKTFKSNVVNYNASYDGDNVNNDFNKWLSSRVYGDYTNDQALYFGYFDENSTATSTNLNDFKITNNLAMRGQKASDYHASIQNLVAEKLDTARLNSNGFPLLETYTDKAKTNKINMPLFDYDALATDKASQTNALIKRQYLGVDFPMYESEFNGITTYSYDSSTDPNRAISLATSNFVVDDVWRQAAEYLGYAPFILTDSDLYGNATELDVEFYMSNTGSLKDKSGNSHDITFNFSGDDDVWVYVDGVLVLDLGGAHMASAGTINFTDMKVYYKTAANDAVDAATKGINDTWAHGSGYVSTIDLKALLEANGVNFNNRDGNTKHTFQMFYLERGAHDSNMSVSYNLPQASGLNIKNEITANNVNAGLKNAALLAANSDYFTYGVSAQLGNGTLYNNTTAAYNGAVNNEYATQKINSEKGPNYPINTSTDRVYSTTIARSGNPGTYTKTYPLSRTNQDAKAGEEYKQTTSMTSLNGVTYSLSDAYLAAHGGESNLDLTGKTEEDGKFHLLGSQTATFEDKITPHSFVQVYQDDNLGKVKYTNDDTPITYQKVDNNETSNYYTTSYSIYDDHSSTWIKEKSTEFVNRGSSDIYAADKSENQNMFYFSDYGKTGNSAAMTVTFYNDIAVGDIRITKTYNGSKDTKFYFNLTFANIFGSDDDTFKNLVDYNLLTYDVIDENGAYVSRGVAYGAAGIVLKGGETAIISGVPVETRYKVTERAKSGTSLNEINKYVKGPDGKDLANPEPSHKYAERFDSAEIKADNINSTSDKSEKDGTDTYYVNMIPIVEESFVGGAYRTTSYVAFDNIKSSVKIVFNYYDRSVQSGNPATINQAPTTYTVYSSLDDEIGEITDDNAKIKQALSQMISNAAVEFSEQALTKNVVDDYVMWTSQAEATDDLKGIGAQKNIKTDKLYSASADPAYSATKYYRTDSLSQPLAGDILTNATQEDRWVSYKANGEFVEAEAYTKGSDALSVNEINVWLFNTPHEYDVNIYGAKSVSDFSTPRQVTLNGKETGILVASKTDSNSTLTNKTVYYNQRLGKALSNELNISSYINQYGRIGYRGDIEPVNYISRDTFTVDGKNYRFAYWAFDPAGQIVASTNAYYYYRITRDTDLYAVYAETQLQDQTDAGLTIYNDRNDIFVDTSGTSRTRLNVIINPYACEDSDSQLQQTALVYVNLSDQVAGYEDKDIITLFNAYRKQLDGILTADATANSFTSTDTITGITSLNVNEQDITEVTLTTKGFVRNAKSDISSPAGISLVAPTSKNRVQYTLNVKTASLKNSNLMIVGAMYYNGHYETGKNHWKISDNCLYYVNGTCQNLDFGLN